MLANMRYRETNHDILQCKWWVRLRCVFTRWEEEKNWLLAAQVVGEAEARVYT